MRFGSRGLGSVLVVLALWSANAAAASPPGRLLDTLTVDPESGPVTGRVPLFAGQTYTLVVSGVVTQTSLINNMPDAVFEDDAIYCFAASGSGKGCSPPTAVSNMLAIGIGTPTAAITDSPPQAVAYQPTHVYMVRYVPGTTGGLTAVNPQCTGTMSGEPLSCSGSLTIQVFGVQASIRAVAASVSVLDKASLQAQPASHAASFTFEVKRRREPRWTLLARTRRSTYSFRAKTAGIFEVRVIVLVAGRRLVSPPEVFQANFPSFGRIVADRRVRAYTNASWQSTLAHANRRTRREEGYFIQLDTCHARYTHTTPIKLGPLVGPTMTGSVYLGQRPPDTPAHPGPTTCAIYTVASFHTHTPTRFRPVGRGVGPSSQDDINNDIRGVPGIVYDYIANPLASDAIPAGYPLRSPAKVYLSGPLSRDTPP